MSSPGKCSEESAGGTKNGVVEVDEKVAKNATAS